jgi:Eukaryotic and archaeal DNA primase, large subunit
LFATRLDRSGADFALAIIQAADGPDIRPVPADLLESIRMDLDAVARGVRKAVNDQQTRYYQVAFEHVAPLVRSRRVLVRAGFAYVPERNIRDVVSAQFRAKLSHGLMTAAKAVGLAEQDSRMRPILETVRAHHAAEASNRPSFEDGRGIETISLNDLNAALPSVPLCMANMIARLRAEHHLRHSGRMQLGLFLKGCGLNMDESLQFWRTEFARGGVQSLTSSTRITFVIIMERRASAKICRLSLAFGLSTIDRALVSITAVRTASLRRAASRTCCGKSARRKPPSQQLQARRVREMRRALAACVLRRRNRASTR